MSQYRLLFQVDIAHDYFHSRGDVIFEAQPDADRAALTRLWDVRRVLDIVPDPTTATTLRGHKMIFRATEAGCVVAAQLDPAASDVRPLIPPAADFALVFCVRVREAAFANYTELGPPATGFYRFGNDSQNSVAGTAFLSRRVPGFDATRRYVAGETYSQAAGLTFDLFVALRDTGPGATPLMADWRRIPQDTFDPAATYQAGAVVLLANRVFRALVDDPGTDLSDATQWQPAATLGNQYVTAADAIRLVGGLLDLEVSDLAQPQVTIQLFRPNAAVPATEQTFTSASGVVEAVQVDLRGLAAGTYRLKVLDAARTLVSGRGFALYHRVDADPLGALAAIEIGLGNGDFALLNADGTLRSPRFVLRFLNRATRWRYIFPAPQPVGSGADVAPEAGDNRVLVTAVPRPLTRFGSGSRLQADSTATPAVSEEILLPVPDVNRVRRETTGWYSETHLGNLTVGP